MKGDTFLFVELHFTFSNLKVRRSAKIRNENLTWLQTVPRIHSSVRIISLIKVLCKLGTQNITYLTVQCDHYIEFMVNVLAI